MSCPRCAVMHQQNTLLQKTIDSIKDGMKSGDELTEILESIVELASLIKNVERHLDNPDLCPCKACTEKRIEKN